MGNSFALNLKLRTTPPTIYKSFNILSKLQIASSFKLYRALYSSQFIISTILSPYVAHNNHAYHTISHASNINFPSSSSSPKTSPQPPLLGHFRMSLHASLHLRPRRFNHHHSPTDNHQRHRRRPRLRLDCKLVPRSVFRPPTAFWSASRRLRASRSTHLLRIFVRLGERYRRRREQPWYANSGSSNPGRGRRGYLRLARHRMLRSRPITRAREVPRAHVLVVWGCGCVGATSRGSPSRGGLEMGIQDKSPSLWCSTRRTVMFHESQEWKGASHGTECNREDQEVRLGRVFYLPSEYDLATHWAYR